MEREKMIKEIKGGFTERMRLAKEYNEWLEKEGNKARVVLANNPQTMIAFLQMKGWQEVPEDAVVLTKEELKTMGKYVDITEDVKKEFKVEMQQVRKDTATNFFKDLIRQANFHGETDMWFNYERLVTVAKQFGVEVEE